MKNQVLVTGADGFIGKRLIQVLGARNYGVRRCTRSEGEHTDIAIGDIGPGTDWSDAVNGVDTVIHLAGHAHVLNDCKQSSLAEFRRVNVEATDALCRFSIDAGVRRFIFLSSIGVNGNASLEPFTELDKPHPVGFYAVSKYEAEQNLQQLMQTENMQITVIRPPLVYGPGAPGNFARLVNLVVKELPLPLGAVNNTRSYVALDNLVSLISTCIEHPAAANQVFLAGDGEDISTTDLLRRLGEAMGKSNCLFPIPVGLLRLVAMLTGKKSTIDSLCCSLQTDISKAEYLLGWKPVITLDQGFAQIAAKLKRPD